MVYLLRFAALFIIGSVGGWIAELFFRHFKMRFAYKKNRWINPGFLTGPCLPIYGFGLSALYFLSYFGEQLNFTDNSIIRTVVIILSMAVVMTVVELIAGEIFILKMHIRLWDYRKRWGNYKGIICPLFSGIWALVGAVYYLGVHSWLPDIVDYLIAQNYMLFVFGVFYGIFAVDFAYAMQVSAKIKKFAEENGIVVFYAEFKENIAASREQKNQKAEFAFVFRGNIQEYLKDYADKLKVSAENMKEKVKENTEYMKVQIQENTDHIKEKVQENTEEFKEKARENTEHIKGKVQENKDNIKEKIKATTKK